MSPAVLVLNERAVPAVKSHVCQSIPSVFAPVPPEWL
jgi:hypothetical protein